MAFSILPKRSQTSFSSLGCAVLLGVMIYCFLNSGQAVVRPESPQYAYIGPGAGIALAGSFLAVLAAMFSALGVILTWPIRRLWRSVRGRRALGRAHVRRVVILGLDGFDPDLAERLLAAGKLPNLDRLRQRGAYLRLGTTWPPLSPVAWSSFATGTNPGKHNIFDFISRNRRTYGPVISSVRIREPRRTLKLGKYAIPLSRPEITALRKSKPFWTVLGETCIRSAILRVPITFPPDRFAGVQLSAMSVPDLLGTQGTFTVFTDDPHAPSLDLDHGGGRHVLVHRDGNRVDGHLEGPVNAMRSNGSASAGRLRLSLRATGAEQAVLKIDRQRIVLQQDTFSPWVRIKFRLAPGFAVHGICRFYLIRFDQRFEMYCTPIQIDPDRPAMPISQPTVFSTYLARQHGPFATLGLAEDTSSLSERVLSEDAFLQQAYDIHRERESMFFDALDRVRRGAVVCVFDGPDRIQHMFWRFSEDGHPALRGQPNTHPHTIEAMYCRMDDLVGRTIDQIDDQTALLVMSDHGFKSFRRGVDLNAWLRDEGYLALKEEATASNGRYLVDVDFSETRAYAIGLAGIYINQRGREAEGIVDPGPQKQRLVAEIAGKLDRLVDPETGQRAVHQAVPRETVYSGPYVDAAPDLIVGYRDGYRVAWDAAVGKTGASVFCDNTKAWSGDHSIHPDLVPGVLFTNFPVREDRANIVDVAPTTLALLGVDPPAYMEGRSLL